MNENLTFAYPWLLALLPVFLLLPYVRRRQYFQAIPSSEVAVDTSARSVRMVARSLIQPLLHLGFLVCLLISAARPQEVISHTLGEDDRRNLVLSLDASKSMDAKDFRSPSGIIRRMDGVKSVTADFLRERRGDRIGLVIFGSQAFLQAPLTIDHALLMSLVNELRVGVAGDGTAIGDGLGIALKRVEELPVGVRRVEVTGLADVVQDPDVALVALELREQDLAYIVGRLLVTGRIADPAEAGQPLGEVLGFPPAVVGLAARVPWVGRAG